MTITTLIVANILHKNTPVIQYEHPCIDILNNRYVSSTYNFVWKGTSVQLPEFATEDDKSNSPIDIILPMMILINKILAYWVRYQIGWRCY